MRCDSWLAILAAAGAVGCRMTDIDAPIGIVIRDLSANDAANVLEAARCWNLEFGTQFVTGAENQQVEAFYDELTCAHAQAQVQAGWPIRLALCPPPYRSPLYTPFRVVSHELGHVLNIIGHPDDPQATMSAGGLVFSPMFKPVDRDLFAAANEGFVGVERCAGDVIRAIQPGSNARIGHCICNDQDRLDPAQPIHVELGTFSAEYIAELAGAIGCVNLRYATSLELVPPDTAITGPHAWIENAGATTENCYFPKRFQEGDQVFVCSASSPSTTRHRPDQDIGNVLGITLTGSFPDDDQAFLDGFGREPIGCRNILRDPTGVCTCAP